MIVEPFAQNELENNVNPVASTFYAASTLICVPNSLAFNGPALGAQAGENRIKDVAMKSGFSHFKKSAWDTTKHSLWGQTIVRLWIECNKRNKNNSYSSFYFSHSLFFIQYF